MATASPPPENSTSASSPPHPLQSISPPRPKPVPSPWSHPEALHLVAAYRQKWYSLNRGQLKASQWDDLAAEVAARCGFPSPSKTATQCRHKIEKLRKRYRAEKTKPNPRAWEYFDVMHSLEHGTDAPVPIAALPIAVLGNPNPKRGIEIDGEEAVHVVNFAKSSRVDQAMRDRKVIDRATGDRKLSGCGGYGETDSSESEEEVDEGAVAREIRSFAERLERVEKRKVEMMRETHRYRMEMENRRTEMILESQRKIVDTIRSAFGPSNKKIKMDFNDDISN